MPKLQTDPAAKRAVMVEYQLRQRGIKDPRVLEAFHAVARHEFVLPENLDQAYDDCPLPIGEGQTISQPYMVAVMTEALELTGQETVLEVGTGSGYQTAILARLARHVYTVEASAALARRAREKLAEMDLTNVTSLVGDGGQGYPPAAPYGAIVVTAAAPSIPSPLTDQLAEGGRLLIPVGPIHGQELVRIRKHGTRLAQETINQCRFVPLTGKYGWGGQFIP
ncbi:MAG: protein-L-isoaspartate(D-aspartate) O-methyltransferase [Terriglobia bacterium]